MPSKMGRRKYYYRFNKTLKTMTTKQLTTIEKKIIPLVTEAKSLNITSQPDMEIATLLLSQLNKVNDEIDKEKQKVLKPLNEARTAEINRWKPLTLQYEDAIASLRQKLSTYQTNAVRLNIEATSRIADRVGDGKGKLKIDTAVRKIEALDKPVEAVSTPAGTLRFRTDRVLRIIDTSIIPRQYLVPDEATILTDLKAGITVAGCVLEEVQVAVNNRT